MDQTDNKWMWAAALGLAGIGVYMYTRKTPASTVAEVTAPATTISPSSSTIETISPQPASTATTVTPDVPLGTPSQPQSNPSTNPTYRIMDLGTGNLTVEATVPGVAITSPTKPTEILSFEQAAALKPATFYDWEKLTQAPISYYPAGCTTPGGSGVISWQGNDYPYSDCKPSFVVYLASANAYQKYAAATPGALQTSAMTGTGIPSAKGNQVVLIA